MQTDLFDYSLPDDLIAQHPASRRDGSRLMVLSRSAQTWEHRQFADLPTLLNPGDLLVRNNSRVIPARLLGHRQRTGGKWEGLFLAVEPDGTWQILARTRGRPQPGESIQLESGLSLQLLSDAGEGRWFVRPSSDAPAFDLLAQHGTLPLPPYIRKGRAEPDDRERYQTIYAAEPGSVAAPTAGLHFTPEIFTALENRQIQAIDLTLHVGIGTFRPIEVDNVEKHTLHHELANLSPEAAQALNSQRQRGGRIVAVGTTAARTLETASVTGTFQPFTGQTNLYIRPGHVFNGLDALITNFHLPRSSLLVLVAALAGYELTLAAYKNAVEHRYRFFSYGDAMLILP